MNLVVKSFYYYSSECWNWPLHNRKIIFIVRGASKRMSILWCSNVYSFFSLSLLFRDVCTCSIRTFLIIQNFISTNSQLTTEFSALRYGDISRSIFNNWIYNLIFSRPLSLPHQLLCKPKCDSVVKRKQNWLNYICFQLILDSYPIEMEHYKNIVSKGKCCCCCQARHYRMQYSHIWDAKMSRPTYINYKICRFSQGNKISSLEVWVYI